MGFGRSVCSIKRIRKELSVLWIDPPTFCRPGASPVTNPYHFEVIIDGPVGSPYAGGTFLLDVVLPKEYPFDPPKFTFKTKVYHPNIDSKGRIFVDIFMDNWSAGLTISKALLSIVSVLYDPLLDLPVCRGVALQYTHDQAAFEKTASDWTRRYAAAPVVSSYPAGKKEGDSKDPRARRTGALLLTALARLRSRPIRPSVHAARVHVAPSLAC